MDCLKKNKIELNIVRPSLVYNSYIFGEKLIYLWQNIPISLKNDSYIFETKLMNPWNQGTGSLSVTEITEDCLPVSIKKDLKDEKQQHPYDLIFYYSYLYKVIRHGENPIEGGAIRSLLVPILNIHLRIKNNINDYLKIVRTFHFKSQNILIKKYILFKENVPAIFRIRNNQRTMPAIFN